jgi:hypothetical protein
MHDGAPTHFSLDARRYLNRKFPGRWIDNGEPLPDLQAPNLIPLDFYLWDHLKPMVYSSPVDDMETLHNRIVTGFQKEGNMPEIWDLLRVAMRSQAEAWIR